MHYHSIITLMEMAFPVATILLFPALCIFSYLTDKKEYGTSDDEKIYELARFNNCSEFAIFCLAAERWNINQLRIEHDFGEYINDNLLPFYVRNFLRNPPVSFTLGREAESKKLFPFLSNKSKNSSTNG